MIPGVIFVAYKTLEFIQVFLVILDMK